MSWRDLPVSECGLSSRTANSLVKAGVETLGSAYDVEVVGGLATINGLGSKGRREVAEALRRSGPDRDADAGLWEWVLRNRAAVEDFRRRNGEASGVPQ